MIEAARTRSCGRKRAKQHRRPDRGEHPSADPLQNPERDELTDARRHPAQCGSDGKHDDRGHQDALTAEAITEPSDAGMNTARLTRKAIEIPSTAVGATRKSRPIDGSATLTIEVSMMLMNIAAT